MSEEEKIRHREAVAKYDREKTKQIKLKLNKSVDADIIEWLEIVPNKQRYLKHLIRKDMEC